MLVPIEELKNRFGGQTYEQLCANLRQAKVKFIIGSRGQPVLTYNAIDAACGIYKPSDAKNDANSTDDPVIEI